MEIKNVSRNYTRDIKENFSYILVSVKNKEITNDIFQEVFFKVINTIQSGNYREEGKFAQWIIRITHNAVIDHFRYQNKYATSPSCEEDDDDNYVFDNISVNNYTSPEDILIKKENKVIIQQAISTLSKNNKK